MTFSMKPTNTQSPTSSSSEGSSVTNEQWEAWNEYFYNLIDTKEQEKKNGEGVVVTNSFYKKKKLVGVLKMIIDCGTQPQSDSSYEWKKTAGSGENLSQDEKDHIAKFPDNYFKTIDGKRYQFKPERPTQEFSFYFDFPKISVDWTKHPIEGLHSLGVKPLRVCYNGYFKNSHLGIEGFAKNLRFEPNYKTGKISPNNPIYKISEVMGKSSKFEEEYDFATLSDGCCFFDVYFNKRITDKGTFYNQEIKNYSEITEIEAGDNTITVEQQIPECPTTFQGAMLNGMEYSDELLDMISHRKELNAVLPKSVAFQPNAIKAPDFWLGVNWEECDLKKALDEYKAKNSQSNQSQVSGSTKDSSGGSVTPSVDNKPTPVQSYNEPEQPMDFDDDIPF